MYYLCLLQNSSHHVLFVATVATFTCYHFAFRLVSYVQKTEYYNTERPRFRVRSPESNVAVSAHYRRC